MIPYIRGKIRFIFLDSKVIITLPISNRLDGFHIFLKKMTLLPIYNGDFKKYLRGIIKVTFLLFSR